MRNALSTAGLAAAFSAIVVVLLAMPVTAVATQVLRSGHAGAGPLMVGPARASMVLTGKLDMILRLVRCPVIKNGNTSVRWM